MRLLLVALLLAGVLAGTDPVAAQGLLGANGRLITSPNPPAAPNAASLTSISGLTDWWDASALTDTTITPTISNFRDTSGAVVSAWDTPIGSIVSKGSGGHALTVGGTGQVNWPKLDGASGGLGNPNNFSRYVAWHWPVMFPDNSLTATTGSDFGSNFNWSLLLVWSRPNVRQAAGQVIGGTGPTGAITLANVGTIPLLRIGGAGLGADTLNLLPTGANISLGTMTRRHTHTLILTNVAGAGITAILDGTQVATGVSASALGTSNTGALLLMAQQGVTNGSAQCWFHEAAIWNRALGTDDLASVKTILASRYPVLGNRKGIVLVVNGQSNASYGFSGPAIASSPNLDSSLAYQLGVLGVTLLNDDISHGSGNYQIVPSNGIADRATTSTGFLKNLDGSGPTFNPSVWPANLDAGVQANINAQSAADQGDIAGMFWDWGENDSANWFYSDKATYNAIVKRQLQLERSYITAVQPSASAANLPTLMMAVPYGSSTNGAPMVHEVYTDLAGDGVSNFGTYLQTYDTLSMTDSAQDPTTGNWTLDTSNAPHRSYTDDLKIIVRAAPAIASMLMASGRCEYYCAMPAGVMTGQGPRITNVTRDPSNPALLHLTITHDGGTDLIVSPGAATCHGFAVSKGTPPSNTDLQCNGWATGGAIGSVTRIDATHIDVLFPSSTAGYTTLLYPVPSLETAAHPPIGPNNAVTDNWASVAPANWNPAEIGFASQNYPLQMPGYGIAIN